MPTSAKILQAAADLLRSGGVEAVSTRAVAAAAGVQPPTLYRQFGDKDGLLDALTQFVLQNYLHAKRRLLAASEDPVEDLIFVSNVFVQRVRYGVIPTVVAVVGASLYDRGQRT